MEVLLGHLNRTRHRRRITVNVAAETIKLSEKKKRGTNKGSDLQVPVMEWQT